MDALRAFVNEPFYEYFYEKRKKRFFFQLFQSIYIYIYIYKQRSHVGEYGVLPYDTLFDKEFVNINSLLKYHIRDKD